MRALVICLAIFCACGKIPPSLDAGAPDAGLTLEYEIASTCQEITLAAHKDSRARDFLYVAAKEGGLRVYDVSGPPGLKKTIPISALGGLHVMNLSQAGTQLVLALGNTFGTTQQASGMALIDVTDPANATVLSLWKDSAGTAGAGIAVIDDHWVYLGAMGTGVIIFDIADPAHPIELSRFKPEITFPDSNVDPAKVNARGMQVVGNRVYLCYDAGGFRVLDVSDRTHPSELGRYSNPALNGKPRAYNNVVLDGNNAYLGFDYCGVEVVGVSDPAHIAPVGWWNPWHCEPGGLTWFSSNGHANEVALDAQNKLLFVSTGKSDLDVLDVSNPAAPTLWKEFGGPDNNIGTWGVSLSGDEAFLTYTCATIPFSSNWTGVKALTYRK